jgi:hypothetical protein
MTRLGTSVVACGGAGRDAETPTAPNEMAAIQTESLFIGSSIAPREIAKQAPATLRPAGSCAPHETTGALQCEQMFLSERNDPKFPQTRFEVALVMAGSLDDRVVEDNGTSTGRVFDEGETLCHS